MLPDNYFELLGFSPKEAKVYTTLHRFGPSPASTIARLTNIKRTSMYDILNALLEKNLIITYQQGKTTFYAIDDINKLTLFEKERVHTAEQLVQQLQNIPGNKSGINVHFYRGIEGFREMYEDILRAKVSEIQAWLNLDRFYSGLDMEREEQWTKERVKQKKYARLLMVDTPLAQNFKKIDKENYRETRLFPPSTQFDTTCFLYENYITFFSSEEPMIGIRIHNPALYHMQKTFFELHWTTAGR